MNQSSDRHEFPMNTLLSPRRHSSKATNLKELVDEQLAHFGIDLNHQCGKILQQTCLSIFSLQYNIDELWKLTGETLKQLSKEDRQSFFNAKKFLAYQIAKILDNLQNPLRQSYQSLFRNNQTLTSKGPYPLFDNVAAIFSTNPVVVRSSTYVYACTEWIEDAFKGKEFTHQIYSRLLNPTSIALANHIVDLEAGKNADQYLAWNFNSGMAAIDALFSNVFKRDDIVIVSRNIYGGVFQLLNDFYAKKEKLNLTLEWFDGSSQEEFGTFLKQVKEKHRDRLSQESRLHVYLESPCNPHGYVLDIFGICELAHAGEHLVMLDATVGSPFLNRRFLERERKEERPDYIVHSYTKDISGHGGVTAGTVIGENYRMFIPKNESANGVSWEETMFWDVYYIKGGFLDTDKAYDVMQGMKTLECRMLSKCINTVIFAKYLESHPDITVNCNIFSEHSNAQIREKVMFMGLPAPLFTFDLEKAELSHEVFLSFIDSLSPMFNNYVSLGQSDTGILCPALTTHSELGTDELLSAGIKPTLVRITMGTEQIGSLIKFFYNSVHKFIEPHKPGFCKKFLDAKATSKLISETYLAIHQQYIESSNED